MTSSSIMMIITITTRRHIKQPEGNSSKKRMYSQSWRMAFSKNREVHTLACRTFLRHDEVERNKHKHKNASYEYIHLRFTYQMTMPIVSKGEARNTMIINLLRLKNYQTWNRNTSPDCYRHSIMQRMEHSIVRYLITYDVRPTIKRTLLPS